MSPARHKGKLSRFFSRIRNPEVNFNHRPQHDAPDIHATIPETYNESLSRFLDRVGLMVEELDENEIKTLWSQARADTWMESMNIFHSGSCLGCDATSVMPRSPNMAPTKGNSSISASESRQQSLSYYSAKIQMQYSYDNDSSIGIANLRKAGLSSNDFESPESTTRSDHHSCENCSSDNPMIFPYVSDAAAAAVIVLLEILQTHSELSFTPMMPRASSENAEYLDDGMSFSVTHVSWEQFRTDTSGRKWTDAVYKRVNPSAPRKAWLYFLKDLVVTHHMSFHVPISQRNHVVRLIGVGWEPAYFDEQLTPTLYPVIALEYADYGTLQSLFSSSSLMSSYQNKKEVLLDVADGLLALHGSGIIHGDVKPQNILIFKYNNKRGFIAKLSDFGLSVIDAKSGPEKQFLPGGSFPYTAPESSRPIPKAEIMYTDVYSFGIVAWQTLLHGKMPFFSNRYRNGEPLTENEIQLLKTGQHSALGNLYNISLSGSEIDQFHGEVRMDQEAYEPRGDAVNDLLVAIARDALGNLDEFVMPRSELSEILSLLQIALSSRIMSRRLECCRLILGGEYRGGYTVSVLNWEQSLLSSINVGLKFQGYMSRVRYMFAEIFERFFSSLTRQSGYHDFENLSHYDKILASHLSSALLEHYIQEYLAGDNSEECRYGILKSLKIASATGNLSVCAAAFGIHEYLDENIEDGNLFAAGMALAVIRGDNASVQHIYHRLSQKLKDGFAKQQLAQMRYQMTLIQTRVFAGLQSSIPFTATNVNQTNAKGDTVLHLACKAGDFVNVLTLLQRCDASASIKNVHGEEPMHWLHRFGPHMAESVGVALVNAGADVDCEAEPRMVEDPTTDPAVLSIFSTPLLRAILRRNVHAVKALLKLNATVSTQSISIAAFMLEAESLDIMLSARVSPPVGTDAEGPEIWERAIHGISCINRIKFYGREYKDRVKYTLSVLTRQFGTCLILPGMRFTLEYVVTAGDLTWVEAILQSVYADPQQAILAELQKGLLRATVVGRHKIFAKIMDYGALPLLPEKWSNSQFVAGVPNKWSARLVEFLLRNTDNVTKTSCALHLCAGAGKDGHDIARTIVETPVRNPRLKPNLPVGSNGPHFVTKILEGGPYPGIDRCGEDGKTALYWAISHGEFQLAKYLLSKGASKDLSSQYDYQHGSSIISEVLQDRKGYLPLQIKFLLDTNNGPPPSFKIRETVIGRMQPLPWGTRMTGHERSEFTDTRSGEATIITAAVKACQGMDPASKKIIWNSILHVFQHPDQILERPAGKSALQLAVDTVDEVTLEYLVSKLTNPTSSFTFTTENSVIDRIRDLLISDAPAKIADSSMKEKIIRYRCSLGDMITTMYQAGDPGLDECKDLLQKVLQTITNEYPILVHGFQQSSEGLNTIEKFQNQTQEFLGAFLTSLYCCRSRKSWREAAKELERGFSRLIAPYFKIEIASTEHNAVRKLKINLMVVQDFRNILAIHHSKPQREKPLSARHSLIQNSTLTPVHSSLFKKLIYAPELQPEKPDAPRLQFTLEEYNELIDLELGQRGRAFTLPSPERYLTSLLSRRNPNRAVREISEITSGVGGRSAYWVDNSNSFQAQIEEKIARRTYTDVVRQLEEMNGNRNPELRSHNIDSRMMTNLIIAQVENRIDTMMLR